MGPYPRKFRYESNIYCILAMYQQGNSEVLEITGWVRHSSLKEFTSSREGKKGKEKRRREDGRGQGKRKWEWRKWGSVEERGYYNFLIINRVLGTDIDSISFNSQKYNFRFIIYSYFTDKKNTVSEKNTYFHRVTQRVSDSEEFLLIIKLSEIKQCLCIKIWKDMD